MDQKQREKIDEMILKLPLSAKKRTLRSWREFAKTLPDDGREIMLGRIRWLKKSMPKRKKRK